jgi:hypothetical protein
MEGLTRITQRISLRIVALLVLLELVSVSFVWTLNPVSGQGETTFALFLALDLVAFAMISYVYRVNKRGDGVNRVALLSGCCFALLLLFAGLLL